MQVRLNVLLVTYNHSRFIEETLNSILMQKTKFDFNIIVADDKSTDDTLEKIKSIELTTNIEFIYLKLDKNLGITKNYQRAFQACNAEYVAVIEGDDIWTDPERLQKHVDFLDQHQFCTMSFNRYLVANYDEVDFCIQPMWEPPSAFQILTVRDIVRDNIIGNFSTCVYRRSILMQIPDEMFELKAYDWLTNIMVGSRGMIGYLKDIMSVYRIHSGGVWSGQKDEEKDKELLETIDIYDKFTKQVFHNEFMEHKDRVKGRMAIAKPIKVTKSQTFSKFKRIARSIGGFTPPIIKYILKLLIPSKIVNKLVGR